MEHIRKNFGFGCMRLPMDGENVNIPETKQMVDAFLDAGFNYFDTAHGYLQGKSETALRECLTSRYPRERYILTDKLTANFFKTEADIRPFFESQLAACGVEYFDFYLMHAQGGGELSPFPGVPCIRDGVPAEGGGQGAPCGHLLPRHRRGAGADPRRLSGHRGGADPVQLSGLRRSRRTEPSVL